MHFIRNQKRIQKWLLVDVVCVWPQREYNFEHFKVSPAAKELTIKLEIDGTYKAIQTFKDIDRVCKDIIEVEEQLEPDHISAKSRGFIEFLNYMLHYDVKIFENIGKFISSIARLDVGVCDNEIAETSV